MTNTGSANHQFGGAWTSSKLSVVRDYLQSYCTALQRQPFRKAYIDAFAGTQYYEARTASEIGPSEQSALFPDLAEQEPQALLEGSARLAIGVRPAFDSYIFIERRADRCADLERLKVEFPDLAAKIIVRQGEANEEIKRLCRADWRSSRAVMFLDPYGMQVDWTTLEAIARTHAVDLWLLFPLGVAVNRLLTRSGEIPPAWRQRLDSMLGTEDWYDALYTKEFVNTLFGEEERVLKVGLEEIGRYYVERLRTIFVEVATPGVLRNSVNNPLYLLCFAVGNERAGGPAMRIANHLLRGLTSGR